jgi:hypothetical protein
MSEEQRNEETEVEAHGKHPGQGLSANDEPDDEVEGHIMKVDRPKPHS